MNSVTTLPTLVPLGTERASILFEMCDVTRIREALQTRALVLFHNLHWYLCCA
jgi:hypothetical protein